jgi:hypothetical protein
MTILILALPVSFAAFVVWITVRFINRRERWAKWLLVATIFGAPILYVLSVGPAAYMTTHGLASPELSQALTTFYSPLDWIMDHGPGPVSEALLWYASKWWADARLVDDPVIQGTPRQ